MNIVTPRCKQGDRALVFRNTLGLECYAHTVGRYVVVVRHVHHVMFEGQPLLVWTYDPPSKMCACDGRVLLRFLDDDLLPLPDPGEVEVHDKRVDIDLNEPVEQIDKEERTC